MDMVMCDMRTTVWIALLNHTVGSIAKLLRDLESPPMYSTREIFVGSGSSPLFLALLTRAAMCEGSLPPPLECPVEAATLPLVLNIQLDNACSDNKNRYVFSFFSLLFTRGCSAKCILTSCLLGILMKTLTPCLEGGVVDLGRMTIQHFQRL
jgi:hypothetical protein